MMAPFYGAATVPAQVKIGLSVILALGLWPVLPHTLAMPPTLPGIVAGIVGEMLLGLAIGMAVTILFGGLQLAGLAVSQQMGISLAEVFDPNFGDTSEVVGTLYYWVGLMLFLAIGGHRLLIGAVLDSFKIIPLGGAVVSTKATGLLTGALTASVVMAFKMSLPVVLTLFLTSVAMGLISRTLPQLNIMTAGFALRTSLGLLMAAVMLAAMMRVFLGTIEQAMLQLNTTISGWAGVAAAGT
jgi:flagellar biosynthetic protein FliR